jgi:hypothetical protein
MITKVNTDELSYNGLGLVTSIPPNLMKIAREFDTFPHQYVWVCKNDCLLRIDVNHTSLNQCGMISNHIEMELTLAKWRS